MNSKIDWPSVRERVIAMEEEARRACGLAPAQYPTFEPALTPGEIAEVEAQCGVELPADYRSFLAEVGAGGPGPAIALTSLRRIDGRWGWVWDDDEAWPWLLDSSGPFVETEDWPARQTEILRAAGHEPTPQGAHRDDRHDFCKAFGDAGHERWHRERGRGAIHISDNGCGMTGWLIVVGPHRGELRDRDQDINPPFEPHVDAAGNRHTFGTWYLEWLDRRESAAQ